MGDNGIKNFFHVTSYEALDSIGQYFNRTWNLHDLFPLSIPLCVLKYIKIMLNFAQSNTTYFSGGNMFRLTSGWSEDDLLLSRNMLPRKK
jgi:hypothetical protein